MKRGKSRDACQANCVVNDGRRVGRRSAGQTTGGVTCTSAKTYMELCIKGYKLASTV